MSAYPTTQQDNSGHPVRPGIKATVLACLLAPAALAYSHPAPAPETAQPASPASLADLPVPPAPAPTPSGTASAASAPADKLPALPPGTRNGREIYQHFRQGLSETACPPQRASARWRKHFSAAPERMAEGDRHVLALFGYVVDALRDASLPTEYALIPFVESGYNPAARNGGGPAGLWQFIKLTARAHDVEIRPGYDGRLSPIDSTRAAVRYLKTLHGMFAGRWRLAAMAYNAGEYRLFGALRDSGQEARNADPERLTSLSGITRAYPRKIHALSCLLQQADDSDAWLERLERPVPTLTAVTVTSNTRLGTWARQHDADTGMLRYLNPVYRNGRVAADRDRPRQILVPARPPTEPVTATPPQPATTVLAGLPAPTLLIQSIAMP